jgi:hypothetical protein
MIMGGLMVNAAAMLATMITIALGMIVVVMTTLDLFQSWSGVSSIAMPSPRQLHCHRKQWVLMYWALPMGSGHVHAWNEIMDNEGVPPTHLIM